MKSTHDIGSMKQILRVLIALFGSVFSDDLFHGQADSAVVGRYSNTLGPHGQSYRSQAGQLAHGGASTAGYFIRKASRSRRSSKTSC